MADTRLKTRTAAGDDGVEVAGEAPAETQQHEEPCEAQERQRRQQVFVLDPQLEGQKRQEREGVDDGEGDIAHGQGAGAVDVGPPHEQAHAELEAEAENEDRAQDEVDGPERQQRDDDEDGQRDPGEAPVEEVAEAEDQASGVVGGRHHGRRDIAPARPW
jgi:hypothetical protein